MADTRSLRRWGALGGFLFVVLFVIGNVLIFAGSPSSDDSPREVPALLRRLGPSRPDQHRLDPGRLGLFALLWFVASLRETVREAERLEPRAGGFLSTVVSIGGSVCLATAA